MLSGPIIYIDHSNLNKSVEVFSKKKPDISRFGSQSAYHYSPEDTISVNVFRKCNFLETEDHPLSAIVALYSVYSQLSSILGGHFYPKLDVMPRRGKK
jgi:hypothetical protein